MSIVDSPESFSQLREDLRKLPPPFLLFIHNTTADDFEQLCDEDIKCEYMNGELVVHSPARWDHEELVAFLIMLFGNFVSGRRLGRVFGSNTVMQLGERRYSPDVSLLLSEHADRIQDDRIMGPMDLVVEILSKSTRSYDLRTKLPAYREGHVGEILYIDSERKNLEVHAWNGGGYDEKILTAGRWNSTVLKGFSMMVDWLWQNPLPSVAECRI